MKKLIGFTVILVALFFSGSAFAQDLTFEVNGKKYEVAKEDLYGYYDWAGAKAACGGFIDPDDFNGDWFLPSEEELNAMYEQLHSKDIGGFAYYCYWNSSEFDEYNAGVQYFLNADQGFANKDYHSGIRVRCIRAL